jgi:hypothetical protein
MEKLQNIQILPSFLLISGDGRNTGKTTLACRILQQFSPRNNITTLKISSHFHEPTSDLTRLFKTKYFSISYENNRNTDKDSSRMLQAGALESYYIQAKEGWLRTAFEKFMQEFHTNDITLCESGALAKFLIPGVHLHISSGEKKEGILSSGNDPEKGMVILRFNGKDFIPSIQNLRLSGNKWQWK